MVTYRVLCTWQLHARLGCKRTGWANSRPSCMSWLRKLYFRLSGGSFPARKASWALSGCLPTESADYCMLVKEWVWLMSSLLINPESPLGFVFGVGDQAESKIWCVTSMCMLKVVS